MHDSQIAYEVPEHEEIISVDYLLDLREKLGRPNVVINEAGWKFVDAILKVWTALHPKEALDLKEAVKNELKYERPIRQSIKKGGHFMIQYPPRLYALFKFLLPEQKLNDRKFVKSFLRRYPDFAGTNYKL